MEQVAGTDQRERENRLRKLRKDYFGDKVDTIVLKEKDYFERSAAWGGDERLDARSIDRFRRFFPSPWTSKEDGFLVNKNHFRVGDHSPSQQPSHTKDLSTGGVMLESLKGKVAWITGAGSGIGRAAAEALARNGAHVVCSGRNAGALRETADRVRLVGGSSSIEPLNIADPAAVDGVAQRIISRLGRIDILVNNAGTNVNERYWCQVTPEKWKEVIDVDLNGSFYCARAVLPVMRGQQDGLIINVSSWAGRFYSLLPGPAYSSAKHALLAMNESLNMEECVNGIRACVLCPGEVWTPIIDRRPDHLPTEAKAKMLKAEDVGETILFIARLPKTVCINEIVMSPTWNRGYIAALTPPQNESRSDSTPPNGPPS
jgi:NAD(P)-dependent dehydrogenase (short-subunit alcohol dehydrogenase family)